MITVNRFKDTITGAVNGVPFTVIYSPEKYAAMQALESKARRTSSLNEMVSVIAEFKELAQENYGALVASKTPFVVLSKVGTYHLRVGEKVLNKPIPMGLVQRIIDSVELGLDPLPLLKLYVRFLNNPKYSDSKLDRLVNYLNIVHLNTDRANKLMEERKIKKEIANRLCTIRQTPITLEGLLVTYKVVDEITSQYQVTPGGELVKKSRYATEHDSETGLRKHTEVPNVEDMIFEPCVQHTNGDAFYCGDTLGHIIQVGKVHYLPSESMVNSNDNESCVPGLHLGNLNYIRTYQKEGTVTLNVYVDPADVRAVPDDRDGAIRVIKYFAHSLFGGQNSALYSSSQYAKDAISVDFPKAISKVIDRHGSITL
jgi:hypothetical protein